MVVQQSSVAALLLQQQTTPTLMTVQQPLSQQQQAAFQQQLPQPQRQRRRCAEVCNELLGIEAVGLFTRRQCGPAAPAALEAIGFRVGRQLAERYSRDKARLGDTLEVIKFLCKDFWLALFKKQVDNLKTNHRVRLLSVLRLLGQIWQGLCVWLAGLVVVSPLLLFLYLLLSNQPPQQVSSPPLRLSIRRHRHTTGHLRAAGPQLPLAAALGAGGGRHGQLQGGLPRTVSAALPLPALRHHPR